LLQHRRNFIELGFNNFCQVHPIFRELILLFEIGSSVGAESISLTE
jgi:hypothetical protein